MELLESYKIDVSNSRQTELISRTITFLKFPLAVLVVILHTNPLTKPTAQIGVYDLAANYPFFSAVTWFFSRVIAYAAVPAFFVISGFLLFYNVEYWIIQHRPHLLSSKLINNSTFIIYAYHGAPQCWLLGFSLPFFIQIGEKGLFVCYLADILIVIGVGLLLSMLIHKSRLLSQILTGI